MDPFVRKLVVRLFDEGTPLSRNRHFHTFETEEGKKAMRLSKRLRALQVDVARCLDSGGTPRVSKTDDGEGLVKIEIVLDHLRSKRLTILDEAEFELLLLLPGMSGRISVGSGDFGGR